MGILAVYLFHKSDPAKKIKGYALLDNASGGTFLNEKSAKALGILGSNTDLILTTIHGTRSLFQALGSWGRAKTSEKKNEGGLRRGAAGEPVRISLTTLFWYSRSCCTL